MHACCAASASRDFSELLLNRRRRAHGSFAAMVRRSCTARHTVSRIRAVFAGHAQGPASYPVPIKVYDETIRVMNQPSGRQSSTRRGDARFEASRHQARRLEGERGPSLESFIEPSAQCRRCWMRSVFGWEKICYESGGPDGKEPAALRL